MFEFRPQKRQKLMQGRLCLTSLHHSFIVLYLTILLFCLFFKIKREEIYLRAQCTEQLFPSQFVFPEDNSIIQHAVSNCHWDDFFWDKLFCE